MLGNNLGSLISFAILTFLSILGLGLDLTNTASMMM